MTPRRSRLVLAAGGIAAIAVLAVVALVVGPLLAPEASPSPTAASSPSPTPSTALVSPSPTPSASPSPTPEPTPPPFSFTPRSTPPCVAGEVRCAPYGFVAEEDLAFTPYVQCSPELTCQLHLDVYSPGAPQATSGVPAPPANGWPVYVALPGGPSPLGGGRVGLATLAGALAAQGAVVVVPDVRSTTETGGGYPGTFRDVACAIRTARALAPSRGGDPSSVTLTAHSFGGWAAAVAALSTRISLSDRDCFGTRGDIAPQRLVDIAAISTLDQVSDQILESFFGGTRAERPSAWAAGDPVVLAGSASSRRLPITFVMADLDAVASETTSRDFLGALRRVGRQARLVHVPNATHTSVLDEPIVLETLLGRKVVSVFPPGS